jgi:ribosomal peptide maturation radical SAM protein 1
MPALQLRATLKQVSPPSVVAGSGRVVLISMPFGPVHTPSIALGLLASELRRANFEVETFYFTIPFAQTIGVGLYELISSGAPETSALLGDWLFRDCLFGAAPPARNASYFALLEEVIGRLRTQAVEATTRWRTLTDLERDVEAVRGTIDGFLDDCVQTVVARDPMLVGFTTVFQQNVASLALASRLKRQLPADSRIVFGGANCEAAMGEQLLATFPQVDAVVSGEGELAVVQLASSLAAGRQRTARSAATELSPLPCPGGADEGPPRATHERAVCSSAVPADIDGLAYPDYDPYFEQAAMAPAIAQRARLLFESARGCWWGAKHPCTFCGLNGTSMAFRSKTAGRALHELKWMVGRYPGHAVSVVDNILDVKYFGDFIPMLAADPLPVELFYEVKANLRKEQLCQLRDANIRRVQPGIESLHDGVLGLMRKGVSAIQNIQFLKWSLEVGIAPLWNLIWGFPGERPEWYAEMARLIPRLHHLPPPDAISPIRLDRFSPLFNDPMLGARDTRPFPAYELVYAELSPEARARLAYHFTFTYEDGRDVAAYTKDARDALHRWMKSFEECAFFSIAIDGQRLLCDLRDAAPDAVALTLLDPIDARLYDACDVARTVEGARSALGKDGPSLSECETRLQSLVASGSVIEIRGRYLSLAIPMNDRVPRASALLRFHQHLQHHNISTESSVLQIPLNAAAGTVPSGR